DAIRRKRNGNRAYLELVPGVVHVPAARAAGSGWEGMGWVRVSHIRLAELWAASRAARAWPGLETEPAARSAPPSGSLSCSLQTRVHAAEVLAMVHHLAHARYVLCRHARRPL